MVWIDLQQSWKSIDLRNKAIAREQNERSIWIK